MPRISTPECRKVLGKAESGNSCLETPGTCESCPEWDKKVLSFTVLRVPPSVNHYVKHVLRRRGGIGHYKTAAANNFQLEMGLMAKGRKIRAEAYRVEIAVYLGKGNRGDLDNFSKVVLDGLVATAVIDTDSSVTELTMAKFRDPKNPRTEITVRAL